MDIPVLTLRIVISVFLIIFDFKGEDWDAISANVSITGVIKFKFPYVQQIYTNPENCIPIRYRVTPA